MYYTATQIGHILNPSSHLDFIDGDIEEVSIDTRTIILPQKTLFFALPGEMNDGHHYIQKAHDQGVRNFVVTTDSIIASYPDSNFFVVEDVLDALQQLATHHQQSFPQLKKIAITGSNGKTIIKEWLYQMLYDKYHIVKSPKSYNSQIGVALSLLGIEEEHELGIFEAGISQKGEMQNHAKMIQPEIGVFTNLGSAHDEGFTSRNEKLAEKMILFQHAEVIVYNADHQSINEYVEANFQRKEKYSWGTSEDCTIQVLDNRLIGTHRHISISYKDEVQELTLRFSDLASFENLMHCVTLMCYLGIPLQEINRRSYRISGLHMRMEMTTGINQSILINDAYSADLDALQIALGFTNQQAGKRDKMAILSALDQSGKDEEYVFGKILEHLSNYGFTDLVYISKSPIHTKNNSINIQYYSSKEVLLEHIHTIDIHQKIVLIKGARRYELEEVSDLLSEKGHTASLQINLNALQHNLRVYNKLLSSETGIISVVKASAYGSGLSEVARLLERNGVNYLAVAFTDEGISLRQAGIETRIMVFNPDLTSLPDIVRYSLEPEVYDLHQLNQIIQYSNQNEVTIDIHLKLDTGMHRLGFQEEDIEELCDLLSQAKRLNVNTIFSHLASSEDESDDAYSHMQFDTFDKMYLKISTAIGQQPKRHILNSGGISRFPNRQYDFVRLGIGMYGIDNNEEIYKSLRKVHRLHASLIQIRKMKAGDSIGYNRKTILDADKTIGIVNIGYADGVMRNLSNGIFHFLINGKEVQILGNVCMDVTIVDLTQVPEAKVGDVATIFDEILPIEKMAHAAGTIPYEILSRISTRVKRKFVQD